MHIHYTATMHVNAEAVEPDHVSASRHPGDPLLIHLTYDQVQIVGTAENLCRFAEAVRFAACDAEMEYEASERVAS